MKKLIPLGSRLIVKVVEHTDEFKSSGGILLASTNKKREKSTLGIVLQRNTESYTRDNRPREPLCKNGDKVLFEQGNVGDELPYSPEGERWLAIPEECIILIVEGDDNE